MASRIFIKRRSGHFKSFHMANRWGFISCDAFPDDVPDRYFEYAPGGALCGGENNKDDFGGGEVKGELK